MERMCKNFSKNSPRFSSSFLKSPKKCIDAINPFVRQIQARFNRFEIENIDPPPAPPPPLSLPSSAATWQQTNASLTAIYLVTRLFFILTGPPPPLRLPPLFNQAPISCAVLCKYFFTPASVKTLIKLPAIELSVPSNERRLFTILENSATSTPAPGHGPRHVKRRGYISADNQTACLHSRFPLPSLSV